MAKANHSTSLPKPRPRRRVRRPRPGEADYIVRTIAQRGDMLGYSPQGGVYILAELPADWFDKLCAYGADTEDLEDSDGGDDQEDKEPDYDNEPEGWANV